MKAFMILCALFYASASAISPCPHPCKCFTADNGIRVANCTDLPDQITTTWPQKILRIHFESYRATSIMLKNKAFKYFPRLTYLDITGGTVQYVGNLAFYGLPELVELNLVGTGIRKLHQNTFTLNRKLAFLSLRKNPRIFVGPSFLVSESITELDLSECALTSLKSVYFKSLPNLKYLFAEKNELKIVGAQFGPPSLKYVNLGHNQIEYIQDDLEAYKRLRTIDLTGNPLNCTCELSDIDKKLTAKGVALGNSITCKNTGKPLGDMLEVCSDKEMLGDEPTDMYHEDNLLKLEDASGRPGEKSYDLNSGGSGSGDDDFDTSPSLKLTTARNEIKNESNDAGKDVVPFPTSQPDGANDTSIDGVLVSTILPNVANDTGVDGVPLSTKQPDGANGKGDDGVPLSTNQPDGVNDTGVHDVPLSTSQPTGANNSTSIEEKMVQTIVQENQSAPLASSEVPIVSETTPTVPPAAPTTKETTTTENAADTVLLTEEEGVDPVHPSIQIATDASGNSSGATRAGMDRGIVFQTIQAAEDEERNVQSMMTEYLKSNVGITVTAAAALLAIIIVAIVYKAVCFGRLRTSSSAAKDNSPVELKEIKYVAADTEDTPHRDDSPTSSAEENLLDDPVSDDDDDDDGDGSADVSGNRGGPTPPAIVGFAQNGLLSSVMDAVKNNRQQPETAPCKTPSPNGSPDVPTRVIVKLTETPKASKPITINNVH